MVVFPNVQKMKLSESYITPTISWCYDCVLYNFELVICKIIQNVSYKMYDRNFRVI